MQCRVKDSIANATRLPQNLDSQSDRISLLLLLLLRSDGIVTSFKAKSSFDVRNGSKYDVIALYFFKKGKRSSRVN